MTQNPWYAWLRSAESLLDRRARIIVLLLLCMLAVWGWCASLPRLIWYDEQLGLAAAMAPHVSDIPAALALPVDLNPPLHHFLMRASIDLFGYSALAARLPSLLAMMGFLYCLFLIVSRCGRPCHGIFAVLLVMCTPVIHYTWEARPYALLLCFTGIALVGYQGRIRGGGRVSLGLFLLGCGCIPLTHYYGILILCAIAAGELLRIRERKQIEWPVAGGFLAVSGAAVLLISGLFRAQWAALHRYPGTPKIDTFMEGYRPYGLDTWLVCLCLVAAAAAVWLRGRDEGPADTAEEAGLSTAEFVIAASLLSLPLLGWLAASVSHVYSPRYFLAAIAGFAVLTSSLVAFFHRRCAGVAFLLIVATALNASWQISSAVRHVDDPPPEASLLDALDRMHLPVVFEDPKVYITARETAPENVSQYYYAAEPDLAAKLDGSGNDDRLMQSLATLQPVQVIRLNDMALKSEDWILVPAAHGWLRKCLGAMGSAVQLTKPIKISQIGELSIVPIRLPHLDSMAASWCEAPPAR